MSNSDNASPQLGSVLLTGFSSIALVLAIATACIAPFSLDFFTGWVATAFMAATPTQVILGLLWQNNKPTFITNLSQPMKGLALTAISIAASGLVLVLTLLLVSGGHGLSPMFVQYIIMTIIVVLWLVVVWQCWPFNLITNDPFKFGLITLLAAYFIAYAIWQVFFEYSILGKIGHPHYYADVDPGGMFDAWLAMTFAVTTVAVVLVQALFDFSLINKLTAGAPQPLRGIIHTVVILALSWIIRTGFVDGLGMDQVEYMIRVPVCMLFGVFLVTNMMQFSLFPKMVQPLRGGMLLLCAIAFALFMYELYSFASSWYTGEMLAMGPQNGFARELWVASAMLGVTFPLIFVVSGFFGFWPIKRG